MRRSIRLPVKTFLLAGLLKSLNHPQRILQRSPACSEDFAQPGNASNKDLVPFMIRNLQSSIARTFIAHFWEAVSQHC